MRRWTRDGSIAIASLLLVATGATHAGAHDEADVLDPDVPDDTPVLDQAAAIEDDAEFIAGEKGIPVDVARDRLVYQLALQDLLASIPEDVKAKSYASVRIDDTKDGAGATIFFKGTVPAEVESLVASFDLERVNLQGGMAFSLNELIERKQLAHNAALDLGFTEILSSINIETQAVTVEVARQTERPELTGAALKEAIQTELDSLPPGMRIAFDDDLELIEHPPGTQLFFTTHGYGGAQMRLTNGTKRCTSAFVVRRSSDWLEGVLTAGHCEGLTKMDQENAQGGVVTTFSAPWKGEHIGQWGDVEWHKTTHDDFPQFWSNYSQRRNVTGRIANADLQYLGDVCRFGRKTGRDCGEIVNTSVSVTFFINGTSVTAEDLVRVRNVASDEGDSGGPWYLATTAYGIQSGENINGTLQNFSKIQNAESAFGVFVQTS